jgi:hypothetical protein
LLAGTAPASNFELVEMALLLEGGWPASTDQFVLAGHLNDRQHKCHQCWRLLKQTASTNVISAGGRLSEPRAQWSSLLAVA